MSELVCKTLELLVENKGSFTSAVKNIFNTKTMATLKISDLSVGDWVRSAFEEQNVRVLAINGDTEWVTVEISRSRKSTCCVRHFSPIPITAEILEKNGFVRGNRGDFYHYLRLDKNRTLYIHASTNGWRLEITYDAAGILRTTHLMPDMNSVHQLQHALRLAGVEKEIVMPNK